MLKRFHSSPPTKPQHAPANCAFPAYFQKQQCVRPQPVLKQLTPKEIKLLQEIIGICRWYCDVTDPLILVTTSKLASEETTASNETEKAARRRIDYLATFPNGKITYE